MKDLNLLDGETIITQSDQNAITLTNYRIRYSDTELGKAHLASIILHKISSIEVKYQSNLPILVIAIVVMIASLVALIETPFSALGLLIGAALLIAFFKSRNHALAITSDGGKEIFFQTQGMSREKVLNFLNQVEEAMLKAHKNHE